MPLKHSHEVRSSVLDGPSVDTSPSSELPWARDDWDTWFPPGIYARLGHRLLDLFLLAATAPLTLPLLMLLGIVNAYANRNQGGALFHQDRVGWRGQVFSLVKFRTMAPAADGSAKMRVTRFGRFLRNTHLDELPQIAHVLSGRMSFIGPRPEMLEIEAWAAEVVPAFSRRLAIRPGITGLAQITQGYTEREPKAYRDKLRINDSYLVRMSLHRDLWVLGRTFVWMLRARGWRTSGQENNLHFLGESAPQRKAG